MACPSILDGCGSRWVQFRSKCMDWIEVAEPAECMRVWNNLYGVAGQEPLMNMAVGGSIGPDFWRLG
jgi:hypothetical protein